MKIKNAWLHFKKICKHKYYVGKYCWKIGLYWQGIIHDMSKFSPIEFFESAKYYQGNRSPIDACKEQNGMSLGWQHHKGRNPHHFEYWLDNFDKGGEALIMPKKYALELICDYIGAAKAYMGKDFTYEKEYEWWLNKKENIAMHPAIKVFITTVFLQLKKYGEEIVLSNNYLNFAYKISMEEWKNKCNAA